MQGLKRFLHQLPKAIGAFLWDFRAGLLVVLVVLMLSLASQIALEGGIVTRDQLAASRNNPFGAVTAIFARWDRSRLAENVSGLLLYVGLFLFTNSYHCRTERERRGRWLVVLSFPAAVAANVAYIAMSPGSTLGASGLVYSILGIAFAFFLINAVREGGDLAQRFRAHGTNSGNPRTIMRSLFWFSMNATSFLFFVYYLSVDQGGLFGVGERGINAFAHLMGFGLGFGVTGFRWFRSLDRHGAIP